MPMIKETLYSAAETATILRLRLGPIRSWGSMLADMRRGKSSVQGILLLPFLQARPDGNLRPFYRMSSIDEFVKRMKALGIAMPHTFKGRVFEFEEPGRLAPFWRTRILVPTARSRYRASSYRHQLGASDATA